MKKEIISKIEALTQQDVVLPLSKAFNELTNQFYDIIKEENRAWEIEKLERIEAGEKPESVEQKVDEDFETFKKVVADFKAKRQIEIDAKNLEEENNLKSKRALISQLKDLVANEEHIGKAINAIKEIQEKWKSIGAIPRDKRQAIQNEYSGLMDEFRYNINIYKEIADNDRVKNLALKKEVIAELKTLLDLDKIKEVESKLHALQERWNEIGGTHQEEWEKIKDDYYGTVNSIYEKIRAFYDNRREEQKENILKKIALIEKVIEINKFENKAHKDFQKTTEKILAIQEEWKTIGYGPKAENEKVWKIFRAECDSFFEKKQAFYEVRNSKFEGIKAIKEDIIKKVEAVKESTDWKGTTSYIVNLQNEWKKAGSAGPKYENKLWNAFRSHIDYFFDAKDAHFKKLDADNAGNLKLKEDLIQKISDYKVGKDVQQTIADLKAFSESFKTIGNVPFAKKDEVYKAYKSALDEKYNQIDLDKAEKNRVLFQAKIDGLLSSPNPEKALDDERFNIRQKINDLNKELNQFETNLSFFANADESNPLLANVKKSIAATQSKIDDLKAQLKLIPRLEKEDEQSN